MTHEQRWTDVDDYLATTLLPRDSVFDKVIQNSRAAGLPEIQVTPVQGRMLQILAMSVGARRILEVGTLGGYSTIWLARGLPAGGRLVTLELNPEHARVAQSNISLAGLSDRVELRVGPAIGALEAMTPSGDGPFDFAFIDADKESGAAYIEHAIRLSRPGTLIVLDNTVREGQIIDSKSPDARVHGTRRALELLGKHPKLDATCIQTVGEKGYDGFALARVRGG